MSFEVDASCRNSVTTDFCTDARGKPGGDQNIFVLSQLRLLLQWVKVELPKALGWHTHARRSPARKPQSLRSGMGVSPPAVRVWPWCSLFSRQLQSGKAVVTATVAVPMAEETGAWLQVIFQGTTHSLIPRDR